MILETSLRCYRLRTVDKEPRATPRGESGVESTDELFLEVRGEDHKHKQTRGRRPS